MCMYIYIYTWQSRSYLVYEVQRRWMPKRSTMQLSSRLCATATERSPMYAVSWGEGPPLFNSHLLDTLPNLLHHLHHQLLYIASFLTFLPGTQPLYLSVAARAAQLDYFRLSTLWHSIWSSLRYSQRWIIWDPAHQDRSYWVSGGRMVCSTLQAIFTPSVRLRTVLYINCLPSLTPARLKAVQESQEIHRRSSINSVYSSLSTRRFCSPGTA